MLSVASMIPLQSLLMVSWYMAPGKSVELPLKGSESSALMRRMALKRKGRINVRPKS